MRIKFDKKKPMKLKKRRVKKYLKQNNYQLKEWGLSLKELKIKRDEIEKHYNSINYSK